MENPCILPSQLVIDADIGSRLLNAAVLRMASLDRASPRTRRRATPAHRLPPRFDSTITLGVAAMLAHCRQLLSGKPLEIMQDQDDRTIMRVCGALDYVIDKPNHRLFVRSADPSPRLMTNELGMTQLADTALTYESIELLSPLCMPLWLHFVAYRPDGICGHNTDADLFQLPLWEDNPDALELLNEICHRAYQRLRADPDFQRLRAALSYRLMEMVGPYTVDLALRARNCADRFLQDCLDGNCLLLSLRQPDSGKRVALMSMERRNSQAEWEQKELSGPCNRTAPAWVEPIVYAVAEMVRQGEEAERATRALLRAVSERTDTCTHGNADDQAID